MANAIVGRPSILGGAFFWGEWVYFKNIQSNGCS
jgi:hypothetical protein